jgi:hypothetical protein
LEEISGQWLRKKGKFFKEALGKLSSASESSGKILKYFHYNSSFKTVLLPPMCVHCDSNQ